jgi:hypothetical protein
MKSFQHFFSQTLIISAAAIPVVNYLALPSIAAILVMIAVRMINITRIFHMVRSNALSGVICLLTVSVCVFVDTT